MIVTSTVSFFLEENIDMFAGVKLPQNPNIAFLILSDPDLRNNAGVKKNIDNFSDVEYCALPQLRFYLRLRLRFRFRLRLKFGLFF